MADFIMEIAGYPGQVHSLFDSTKDYCRAYLSEKMPAFTVQPTADDLVFEQRVLDEEAALEGFRPRIFTDPFLERAAIQRAFAAFLFDRDILLCHGSAVAVDGKGYLFTAKSGTGKSTHTRHWLQLFGSRATMINDDKPFLRIEPDGVWVCGAPWSGKHGLDTNITVPLQGICILQRGAENCIEKVSGELALPFLAKQCCPPLAEEKQDPFQALVQQLAQKVPLWQMTCTKDPQAAQIAYDGMHI